MYFWGLVMQEMQFASFAIPDLQSDGFVWFGFGVGVFFVYYYFFVCVCVCFVVFVCFWCC